MNETAMQREAYGEDLARQAVALCSETWADIQAKRSRRNGFKGGLCRTARVVHARDVAVWALRGDGYSYPEIARIIGFKHHTAAMLACRRKVKEMMA